MHKLLMLGAMVGIGIGVAKFIKNHKQQNQESNTNAEE